MVEVIAVSELSQLPVVRRDPGGDCRASNSNREGQPVMEIPIEAGGASRGQGVPFGFAQGRLSTTGLVRFAHQPLRSG